MCVLVTELCPTLCNPMDYSLPGFSVHGIFQARIHTEVGCHFLLHVVGVIIFRNLLSTSSKSPRIQAVRLGVVLWGLFIPRQFGPSAQWSQGWEDDREDCRNPEEALDFALGRRQ